MSKLVGIFLLGILVGWIIEWIFVRLFVPNTGKKLKSRLEASQKENTTLQQQNSELQASLKSAQEENTRLSQQVAEAQSAVEAAAATPEAEALDAAPVEEAATVEDTTAGKQQVGGDAAAPAQDTLEQVAAEAVPVAAESSAAAPAADEDLTRINGVGPKLAEAMQAAGINTYAQIAGMTEDELNERLAATGVRYVKASVKSWPEQARFAAKADWDGLKNYQESLKKQG